MNYLFTPLNTAGLTLKNRIIMPPMCMYNSDDTGVVMPFHHHHYVMRAMGGVGAIVLEATAVEKRGRISANDLGIWSDEHVEGLSKLVTAIKPYGAAVGVQLGHAGRKCGVVDEVIIAPSPLAFDHHYKEPLEMDLSDIPAVIDAFKQGARRAVEAGFDFVEIHGAHGYLISTFMSPLTNHRLDKFGMAHQKGMRFLNEILRAVKSVLPDDFPVWIRISAEDYDAGGNHATDWESKLAYIDEELYAAVHVSSGGVVPVQMAPYPGYQIAYAATLKTALSKPIIAGGLITEPQSAHVIIATGQADAVFLGRELLRNPFWPLLAAQKLGVDQDWPEPYARAK